MENIAETIGQTRSSLQTAAEKAEPILAKAFPKEDASLVVADIHPAVIQPVLLAMAPFVKQLPANYKNIELVLPSADLRSLNNALSAAETKLEEFRSKTASFYGENFEHTPTREGFTITSDDGQRAEDLKSAFQAFVAELDKARVAVRNIGPWLAKQPKGESIAESVKQLKQDRDNYSTAAEELAQKQSDQEEKLEVLSNLIKEVEGYQTSAKNATEAVAQAVKDIGGTKTSATNIVGDILEQKKTLEGVLGQEEALREKIEGALGELDGFAKKLSDHNVDAEKYAKDSADMMVVLKQNLEQLEASRKVADEIIATATSASLAGAFAKEATSRADGAKQDFRWVVASLAAISVIGLIFVLTHNASLTVVDYIPRVLLMVPLSFIALVANRQLSMNRQAREEYAHKASLSLSFEGYRRLIEDNKEVQVEFFKDTVSELRKNPADKLEKVENEIDSVGRIIKLLEKCPDLLKVVVDQMTPQQAKVFASNENLLRRATDKAAAPVESSDVTDRVAGA